MGQAGPTGGVLSGLGSGCASAEGARGLEPASVDKILENERSVQAETGPSLSAQGYAHQVGLGLENI